MLKNYFKIAWRNITGQKFYSLVNIIGLSAGIAFTFLMAAYVWGELQVNTKLANTANQYIIQSKWKNPDMGGALTTIGPLSKTLKEQYPHLVKNYYRWDGVTSNVSKGEKLFREGLQIGDSTILTMYGFELVHGDKHTAFTNPFSVVITEEKAKKYFNKTDVIGETITIENFSGSRKDFQITGVMKQPERNSVNFINDVNNNQFFLNEKDLAWFGRDINRWDNLYTINYIELQNGITPKDLDKPIQQLLKSNASPDVAANLQPYLVSLKEYYLTANNSVIKRVLYTVSIIALFILLMAIVNFVNVSISRSAARMKEIGIRKVLGSLKTQLVAQFLTESILLVTIAATVALLLYTILRPWFSNLLGREIAPLSAFSFIFWLWPLVLILGVSIMAGIYPAVILSSLRTAEAVKGKFNSIKEKILFRKVLVGFQFSIAAFVLIAAIIVSRQTNYFFNKDLGYNKEYIVTAQLPRDWTPQGIQKVHSIRKQFDGIPEVLATSVSYEVPDGNNSGAFPVFQYGSDSSTAVPAQLLVTDEAYEKTYGMHMLAGNYFTLLPGDTFKVVVNETCIRSLGFKKPEEAIGKQLRIQGDMTPWTIAGVINDFHFGSMQQKIRPVFIMNQLANPVYRFISIKLKPGNVAGNLAALQRQWSKLMPTAPFEYSFIDDKLAALYKQELQLKKASYAATVLALVIVFLGVIGLVALSIQKRIKEIGIRKVLGSSASGIIQLFVKEFLIVMCIALMITCPVVYILMQKWLDDYAYRIVLNAWPFITGITVLGGITILLIGMQTIKTALMNPVKSLRAE